MAKNAATVSLIASVNPSTAKPAMTRLAICAVALWLTVLTGNAQAQTGTISGAVTDKGSGGGLAAMVAVYSWNGALLQSTPTVAATGAYAVNGLPAGVYYARTIVSPALNYVDEAYRNIPCVPCGGIRTTTPIKVGAGETVTINFPLSAGGSITGTVTDRTSTAIANITIQVATSSGTVAKTAASDGSGVWVVGGLPPGTYFARTAVSISDSYFDAAYRDMPCVPFCPANTTTTPISVVGTGTTGGIDFALSGGGSISGTVTNAATAAPVAGVTIEIWGSTGMVGSEVRRGKVKQVSTDAAGLYVARGLAPGLYFAKTQVPSTLNFADQEYQGIACPCSFFIPPPTPIGVGDSATTGHIDFKLAPGGSISGTVREDGTGTPLAGVTVSIRNNDLGVMKTGVSDASGGYVVTGLAPGTYNAATSVPPQRNYVNQSFNNHPCDASPASGFPASDPCRNVTPITVSGTGTTTSSIDFALTPGGIITGTVRDARTGAPAPGVTVDIYTLPVDVRIFPRSVTTAVTRLDGTYLAVGLPPTSYYQAYYQPRIRPTETHLGGMNGTAISLSAGETVSGVDFALYATGDADIVADFGAGNGLWMLGSDNHWQQLHGMSAVAMIRADVDGNHEDDLIVNFGPSIGVWAWMNHASWRFIHPGNPTTMVAADLDRDGRDDLIMAFHGYGVWRWVASGVWTQLHWIDAAAMLAANGGVVVDFPGYGLWTYWLGAGWRTFHPLSATTLLAQNVQPGIDDVVAGFPGFGLWRAVNGIVWTRVHPVAPVLTAAGFVGVIGITSSSIFQSRNTVLVMDFGPPYGVWRTSDFQNGQISEMSAQSLVLADRTADGADEMIISFRDGHGLWQMRNGDLNTSSQLHVVSPKSVVTGRFH